MEESRQKSLKLLREAAEKGLFPELLAQLQKDFDRANIGANFDPAASPEALGAFLHEKVYVLVMERFPDYLSLLYIVDVPERAFKGLPVTDAVDAAGDVAYLILSREWQKVLLRTGPGAI
jgi:hypothetical protein